MHFGGYVIIEGPLENKLISETCSYFKPASFLGTLIDANHKSHL